MLLPVRCPICEAGRGAPCPRCASDLRPAPVLPVPAGVASCAAVLAYEGAARELVARLKYRNARASVPRLAAAMAAKSRARHVDVVTWVPTTAERRRARGFDQAELLARAVARRLHVRCRPLLRRPPGPAQTGRLLADRRCGPVFTGPASCPQRVLLIDDVITTGATVTAAARALAGAGAVEVHVVAAARTPRRS